MERDGSLQTLMFLRRGVLASVYESLMQVSRCVCRGKCTCTCVNVRVDIILKHLSFIVMDNNKKEQEKTSQIRAKFQPSQKTLQAPMSQDSP